MPFTKIDLHLCLFLLGLLSLTYASHLSSVDENLIAQVVESIAERGELSLGPMFQTLPGPDGQYYSRYGIGFPLVIVPFYYLGSGLKYCFPDSQLFCGNHHIFAMLWATILITVGTGWLFYRLCLRLGAEKYAAVSLSLGLILGTSFWPYSQTLYRLTVSALVLILTLDRTIDHQRNPSALSLFAIAGLVAFGLNIREDLILAFGALGFFSILRGNMRERLLRAGAFWGGLAGAAIIWGLHNYIRFGTFFIENYADLSFNYPLIISVPELLYGLRRGLIFYSPLALLLPLSFFAAKRHKYIDLWMICLGILSLYTLLYGKSSMWHGGVCWGPRHLYFLLPFALLPGVWLLDSKPRVWVIVFFVIAFVWGIVVNWPGIYAYQGAHESFLERPSFFELLFKPIESVDYVGFKDFDLWWIRSIKLKPYSIWPYLFLANIITTLYYGYKLLRDIQSQRINREISVDRDIKLLSEDESR